MSLGEVTGPGGNNVSRVRGVPGRARAPEPPRLSGAIPPADNLQISEVGRFASEASALEPVRPEVVAEVRRRIARGDYDEPAILQEALNRMIDDAIDESLYG